MFDGSTGFIEYFFDGQPYPAVDRYFTYTSLTREIYEPIEKVLKKDFVKLKPNTFEEKVGSWFKENLLVKTNTDILIEFTFDNIQVTGVDEVEFDIMAKSNQEGIKFAASDVYISYNEDAFGSFVVSNDKIEATKETVIDNNVYTLELTDDAAQIVKFLVNADLEPIELYPLSVVPEKFLHIKLDIESVIELASLSFEDF